MTIYIDNNCTSPENAPQQSFGRRTEGPLDTGVVVKHGEKNRDPFNDR
jgi:hypothetical protein